MPGALPIAFHVILRTEGRMKTSDGETSAERLSDLSRLTAKQGEDPRLLGAQSFVLL